MEQNINEGNNTEQDIRRVDESGQEIGRGNIQGQDAGRANLQGQDAGRANLQGQDAGRGNIPGQEVRQNDRMGNQFTHTPAQKPFPLVKIVYFILGIMEAFLAIRLVLRLLGASTGNMFVKFVYSFTGLLLAPFSGIFSTAVTEGIETEAVFEPAVLIAMLVYALLAWGIVKLIVIIRNRKPEAYRGN